MRYINKNSITDIVVKKSFIDPWYFTSQIAGEPYKLHLLLWSIPLFFKAKKTVISDVLRYEEFSPEDFKDDKEHIWNPETNRLMYKHSVSFFNGDELIKKFYFDSYEDAVQYAQDFMTEHNISTTFIKI